MCVYSGWFYVCVCVHLYAYKAVVVINRHRRLCMNVYVVFFVCCVFVAKKIEERNNRHS